MPYTKIESFRSTLEGRPHLGWTIDDNGGLTHEDCAGKEQERDLIGSASAVNDETVDAEVRQLVVEHLVAVSR